MIRTLLTAVLFVGAAWAVADEKDSKPGTPGTAGGPPPGKGWRKNETPAPVPTPTPSPKQKGVTPVPPAPKQPANPPTAKKPDDGIGPIVSKWARAGIHGRDLAARIHQLQATRTKATPPTTKPEKKSKPEVTPTPPPTPKKKGKPGGEDE
jgi:hypothetical protein